MSFDHDDDSVAISAIDFGYLDQLRAAQHEPFFKDQFDRFILFHGVNVSGLSKLPADPSPDCLFPEHEAFWDDNSSFVGRPFPLKDAPGHFRRLRSFGISLIRLVITWEAVETAPGVYDEDYLDYLQSLLEIASDLGLLIVLDCHQDCWSRHCGGSGAPRWTMDLAGLDCRNFVACGAALIQSPKLDEYTEPGTLWATNYSKFACNTMFTLFFAGEVFAPFTAVSGENIGAFLRRRYIECFGQVAQRLKHIPGVIGFDVMNEPHPGFIGLQSLKGKFNEDILLHLGEMPSALNSMKLAAGLPQSIPIYTKSWPRPTRHSSTKLFDPQGVCVWADGYQDIWQRHGVWSTETHNDAYFATFPDTDVRSGDMIDFNDDCYVPFLQEFQEHIKSIMPQAYIFVEPVPNTVHSPLKSFATTDRICFAPHWYDLKALFEKRFNSRLTMNVQALSQGSRNFLAHTYFGYGQTIENYAKQYAAIFDIAPVEFPRLVGETGIPFDMNNYYQKAVRRGDEYKAQGEMLDIMCTALERNMLSYTLWNYTPENKASGGGGDIWNGEDFSLFCESEIDKSSDVPKIYSGCRAPRSWIRPTATKIAGVPISSEFDLHRLEYRLTFRPHMTPRDFGMSCQTEIFVPRLHLAPEKQIVIEYEGVEAQWRHNQQAQTLFFVHSCDGGNKNPICHILIKFDASRRERNYPLRSHHFAIILVLLFCTVLYRLVLV